MAVIFSLCLEFFFSLFFFSRALSHSHTAHLNTDSSQELKSDVTFAPDAFEALRCAAEEHLLLMFEEAVIYSVHSKRDVVEVSDIGLANHIGKLHKRRTRI